MTRIRIASRGGLQLAFERGDLDGGRLKAERLYETGQGLSLGLRDRVGADHAGPQPRPRSPAARRCGPAPGPQDAVFAAGEILRIFRDGLTARQVAVLDHVCGLDLTVRAAALA